MTTFTAREAVFIQIPHDVEIEVTPFFNGTKPQFRFVITAGSADPSEAKRKVDETINALFPNHKEP